MLKKLRVKFVIINMCIVTIMLCVIFSLVFHFTSSSLETQSLNMMQALAANPLQIASPNNYQGAVNLPYFTLQISARGDILAIGGGYYDLSDEDFLQSLISSVYSSDDRVGIIDEYYLRYYRVARGTSQCIVFADISSEIATLRSLLKTCALIGGASFALFFAVSLLLAKWAVKPVDAAWRQQRQFVADASHELKTPLTVIMTNAELLQQPEYSGEERSRFSDNILTMSRQMRTLVEALLELARADSGRESAAFAELDLSALVSDSALLFEPVFYESGLEFESKIEEGVRTRGSDSYMKQTVEILLDNARKYSDKPGRVALALQRQGKGRCLLTVSNPGADIPRAELQNIFKRFYRLDRSRSRDGSYGLGLSIAESAVKAQGGRIWAESRDGIITFSIVLPTL